MTRRFLNLVLFDVFFKRFMLLRPTLQARGGVPRCTPGPCGWDRGWGEGWADELPVDKKEIRYIYLVPIDTINGLINMYTYKTSWLHSQREQADS